MLKNMAVTVLAATMTAFISAPVLANTIEEGCTPGFWKQGHHFAHWVGYQPEDSFDNVFGVGASIETLGEALAKRGGGERALGRHAVAALLNTAHPDIDYVLTEAEVIAVVQAAYATGDFEPIKDLLEAQNDVGFCPL